MFRVRIDEKIDEKSQICGCLGLIQTLLCCGFLCQPHWKWKLLSVKRLMVQLSQFIPPDVFLFIFFSSQLGDLTEDPKFPKVQWPTPDICPACHEEIKGLHSWNEDQVLQFLKSHYSSDNILYKYAESQTDPSDNEQGDTREVKDKNLLKNPGGNGENKLQDKENPVDSGSRVLEKPMGNPGAVQGSGKGAAASVNLKGTRQAVSFLGIGFSNLDMSLCVILYVASSLFLMIMYFFFRMRSKRWKVKYYRSSV